MDVDRDALIWMYTKMQTIRQFETRVARLMLEGKLPGTVHLYAGEEAVACGVCANLGPADYVSSTHRGHGHLIAKGGDLDKMMAELFAKSTGYCKGKGGSMHIASLGVGILGANGIVGAGLPIAVGAGFAAKYRKSDAVAVAFFGDGASNQGTFHEAVNLAAVLKAPVIFVCENNGYAVSTSQARHQTIVDVADRARAYGIPGAIVDGNDVFAVYKAAREAIGRARVGLGPSLVECKTYRHYGHSIGDPGRYRTQEEVDAWKLKDPIPRLRDRLIELGVMSGEQADSIDQEVAGAIESAVRFAEESPSASLEALLEDVYAPSGN
ncbi:MAG: thiamine pyrophosphate-dependent dehydrogenase E1 component subunit alpha [Chloroflexi bacterium]|nr:thiamine pyrophosphate-dependent dehydrogenase E1 component subunit alpha [Chloroflexota bacterium]